MQFSFTGDELVLAIIAIVRRVNPRMLNSEADGFSVDFSLLAQKSTYRAEEQLLIRLREASESQTGSLEISPPEAEILASSLGLLEVVQAWPADVVELSRGMRTRLVAGS
jgi:hypothetical protein